MDVALNNLQMLICHKTQETNNKNILDKHRKNDKYITSDELNEES